MQSSLLQIVASLGTGDHYTSIFWKKEQFITSRERIQGGARRRGTAVEAACGMEASAGVDAAHGVEAAAVAQAPEWKCAGGRAAAWSRATRRLLAPQSTGGRRCLLVGMDFGGEGTK